MADLPCSCCFHQPSHSLLQAETPMWLSVKTRNTRQPAPACGSVGPDHNILVVGIWLLGWLSVMLRDSMPSCSHTMATAVQMYNIIYIYIYNVREFTVYPPAARGRQSFFFLFAESLTRFSNCKSLKDSQTGEVHPVLCGLPLGHLRGPPYW